MDEVNEFSIEEGLHQAVILKFSYGKLDLHELCKVLSNKSNKEEQRQLVPDDNYGEGRDYRNNLGVVRNATVDRAVANSFEDATTFNSNNEENLENKGKSIEAARQVVGKDGVLGSPNVVAAKQGNSIAGNSNNEWTLVSHKKMVFLSPQTIRFCTKTILQRLSLMKATS
ncbi:hypothetical protein H5410_016385 [Solanum commersonii]|uniref:Uncharacterized protein n=1 Tax=Solanum commersonii TaxID=4109 RepID=A0A9J5ZWC2_SOLCO|nr:hypothetical protein H5410_016385 [Solanum commersonii]